MLLGLAGHEPDSVDVDAIAGAAGGDPRERPAAAARPARDRASTRSSDLVFHRRETLPFHANGMRFIAFDADGAELANRVYYSVGGGFVVSDEVAADGSAAEGDRARHHGAAAPVPQRRRAAAAHARERRLASPR